MQNPIVFSGNALDRASARRKDAAWLASRLAAEESRFLPLWRLQVLVHTGAEPRLAWARGEIQDALEPRGEPVLLGLERDVAHFALDVSPLEKPAVALGVVGAAEFQDLRAIAAELPLHDAGVSAQAKALVDWHARHRFCAACGGKTALADAGYMRRCAGCSAEHFPRTDPVVIMLVHRGERCLLGRQPGWPAGFVSALAGFVEPGETLEEAVRREVWEEAGLQVDGVAYLASQPWPFPASLMIGCTAEAGSFEIRLDDTELESAVWIEREKIREALRNGGRGAGFVLPPPLAIARILIERWAAA
jgi:NAD+ diphosphatase